MEEGKLLRRDVFTVWKNKKDERSIRSLKSQTRHLFLYERYILFCKKKDDTPLNSDKSATYMLKNLLPVSALLSLPICFIADVFSLCCDSVKRWYINNSFEHSCLCFHGWLFFSGELIRFIRGFVHLYLAEIKLWRISNTVYMWAGCSLCRPTRTVPECRRKYSS